MKTIDSVSKQKDYFFFKYHNKVRKNYFFPKINTVINYPRLWKKIYFKEYPRLPQFLLPNLENNLNKNFFEVIFKRRTQRDFKKKPSLNDLSALLFFSAGINYLGKNPDQTRRMYPSGGARYPLEIYLVSFSKTGDLPTGLYHYNVKFHSLELLLKKDLLKQCQEILFIENNKRMLKKNTFLIIITSLIGRSYLKYGELSYKLSLLEAGHVGENFYLTANALSLKCCGLGWLNEKKLMTLLDIIDQEEIYMYSLIIGK